MATLSATEQLNESPRAPREIEVPAPTAWPFILALGRGAAVRGPGDEHVSQLSWRRAVAGRLLSAGSVKSFRTSMKRLYRSFPKTFA